MNLRFGTNSCPEKSKTKCLVFSKGKTNTQMIKKVKLDGNELPWVSNVKHLGHVLQSNNSMSMDINLKRCGFIGKVNSLLQEFYYASPGVLLKFVQAYACNIYGSNTWNLFSSECNKIYTSYNVAIRNIYNLPRTTHRYMLEPLTEFPHLYTQLLARYITFAKGLYVNNAFEVRFLANICLGDYRTI